MTVKEMACGAGKTCGASTYPFTPHLLQVSCLHWALDGSLSPDVH